jgi:hypothetical protein
MKYFVNVTTSKQAKIEYRRLAKLMHPDIGGSPIDFQEMQKEYQTIVANLKDVSIKSPTSNNEILSELSKLALVLIDKKVPQTYLKNRIPKSKTTLEKKLYSGMINFLDGFQ